MRSTSNRHWPAHRLYTLSLFLLLIVAGGAAVAPGASDGLIAAYSFDEGSGSTLADESGNGNSGSISGASWTTAGKTGGALSFDGVNDWVTIADSAVLDATRAITLEAWVKPSAAGPQWRTVLFKQHGAGMAYSLYASEDTNRPVGQVNVDDVERNAPGAPLALNGWTHLAATYDDATLRLYVNGTLASSLSVNGSIPASTGPLRIGGNSVWNEWFAGQIDDVRIYNRALTATELKADLSTPVRPGNQSDNSAPSPPTGLSASAQTPTSITLSWNGSNDNVGVAGYGRYRSGSLDSNGAGTSYTFSGLNCGSSYSFAVDAYDAAGNRSPQATVSAATSPCATPAGIGLVASYSFDAGAGSTLVDASGNGNTGTISGASWTSTGKTGGALAFDGSNDWVTIADSAVLDATRALTLEAWVKPTASGPRWRTVLFKEHGKGMAYSLYTSERTSRPVGQVNVDNVERNALGAPLPLNAWTHLASTYDGGTLRLYVNGTLTSTLSINGSLPASTGALRMGGNSIWPEWFAGQLDDVRVYNRALTGAELQSDMNKPVSTTTTTPSAPSDTQKPSAPIGLARTVQSATSVTLSWNPATDNVSVAGYGVYRGGTLVWSGSGTSYTVTGLSCGSSYSFAVDAYDAAGNRSAQSAPVSASTSACPQPTPRRRLRRRRLRRLRLRLGRRICGWTRMVVAAAGALSGAAYSDAAACASFNAAYQAASAGDLVQVTAGTYPSQDISPKPSASAPAVVIEAAAGATVVVKELDITASWLTLRNMTVQPVAGRNNYDKIIDINHGSRQVTLDNVDLDGRINGVRQVRDGLGISGDTDYVTVKNSDLCCIQDQKLIQIQTYGTSVQNRHLTLSRNTIHDDWQTDSSKHLECLWLEGISDFLLDGNHFCDCALNAIIANADEGGTYANWTITNNVFEAADTGVGGIPPDIDACAAHTPRRTG